MQFNTHEEYLDYYRKYRDKNREKLRAYNREYNKVWRKKFGYHNELLWKTKNRVKVNVEAMLRAAVKRGVLKRSSCIICGEKKSQAHHNDYNKPLEVLWLCAKHHKQLHLKKN